MPRPVFVTLVLVMLAMAVLVIGRPLWERYQAQAAQIEEQQFRLHKMRRLASRQPRYEREVAALQTERDSSPALLGKMRPAQATADLQARLKRVLESNGGRLLSAKPLKVKEEGPFSLVTLDASVQVSNSAMQALLRALEADRPRLVLEWLSIDGPGVRRGRVQRSEPLLRLRFQVRGVVAAAG